MTQDPLNQVAQFIQAKKIEEAQSLLKPILQADPHNIRGWLLEAQIIPTLAQKKAVLELALRLNPEAVELRHALGSLDTGARTNASVSTQKIPANRIQTSRTTQPLRTILVMAVIVVLTLLGYLYRQPLICDLHLSEEACIRVLFIGNSYTYVNDLPGTFTALAWSGGHPVVTDMSAQGGWTLSNHLNSATTLKMIDSSKWNFVVLQEQSELPASLQERSTSMFPAARSLVKLIEADGARPAFLLTWAHRDGWPEAGLNSYAAMQDQLNNAYLQIGHELSATIAPGGVAWSAALRKDPQLQLWQSDGSHPSEQGTYLVACVFYAVLFNQSPVGLSYTGNLSRTTAQELQTAAAETVLGSPKQWGLP